MAFPELDRGVYFTLPNAVLVIDSDTAAGLVQTGIAYLCPNCPHYHLNPKFRPAVALHLAAIDLRTPVDGAAVIDPAVAALIAASTGGAPE